MPTHPEAVVEGALARTELHQHGEAHAQLHGAGAALVIYKVVDGDERAAGGQRREGL
jgi:hypothetical protein